MNESFGPLVPSVWLDACYIKISCKSLLIVISGEQIVLVFAIINVPQNKTKNNKVGVKKTCKVTTIEFIANNLEDSLKHVYFR